MFFQFAFLFICLMCGLSVIAVLVCCMKAPLDDRLDPIEKALIDGIKEVEKRDEPVDLQIPTELSHPSFSGTLERTVILPPQNS